LDGSDALIKELQYANELYPISVIVEGMSTVRRL
jgi:hypothetical protein